MKKPALPSEIEQARDAILALSRFQRKMTDAARERSGGITEIEAEVLKLLLAGATKQAALQSKLEADAAWISRTVAKLAAAGLVERERAGEPKRTAPVKLTPRGRERAERISAEEAELWQKAWRHLQNKKREDISRSLEAVQEALRLALEP